MDYNSYVQNFKGVLAASSSFLINVAQRYRNYNIMGSDTDFVQQPLEWHYKEGYTYNNGWLHTNFPELVLEMGDTVYNNSFNLSPSVDDLIIETQKGNNIYVPYYTSVSKNGLYSCIEMNYHFTKEKFFMSGNSLWGSICLKPIVYYDNLLISNSTQIVTNFGNGGFAPVLPFITETVSINPITYFQFNKELSGSDKTTGSNLLNYPFTILNETFNRIVWDGSNSQLQYKMIQIISELETEVSSKTVYSAQTGWINEQYRIIEHSEVSSFLYSAWNSFGLYYNNPTESIIVDNTIRFHECFYQMQITSISNTQLFNHMFLWR